MQDIIQEVIDYLKGIWIKRRYIIISTWLICPIGWYMVASMPNVYKSQARVFVDTQSLLRPLLRGLTISTNPENKIALMVKTLLSRANVERISRMTDLDVQANNDQEYEIILANLKKSIKISSGGRQNIYTLSTTNQNAQLAKNIVQAALTVFIENTLGDTRNDSDKAQKFLDTQIKEYEIRLTAAEAKVTEYTQRYSDILPQSGSFYGQLSNRKKQLKTINLEILENKTRLKSAKTQLASIDQSSTEPSNKIQTQSSIKTTYDQRIENLERQLDNLKLKYTDKHPDVIQINKTIKQMNELRTEEINKYLESIKVVDGNYTSQNPVIQEVQIQINQLENLIASLNVRAANYKRNVADLESKIHMLPEIQAEKTALNRDYGIIKGKYQGLLARKETVLLSKQEDETTEKIEFKVIDPPRVPNKPSGPARLVFFSMITIVGIGVGIGFSLVMSQLNPIVISNSQLSRATGIPVFGNVSANNNLGLQRLNRKKTVFFMLSNILLLVLLMMFISYFMFPNAIQAPLNRIF